MKLIYIYYSAICNYIIMLCEKIKSPLWRTKPQSSLLLQLFLKKHYLSSFHQLECVPICRSSTEMCFYPAVHQRKCVFIQSFINMNACSYSHSSTGMYVHTSIGMCIHPVIHQQECVLYNHSSAGTLAYSITGFDSKLILHSWLISDDSRFRGLSLHGEMDLETLR